MSIDSSKNPSTNQWIYSTFQFKTINGKHALMHYSLCLANAALPVMSLEGELLYLAKKVSVSLCVDWDWQCKAFHGV